VGSVLGWGVGVEVSGSFSKKGVKGEKGGKSFREKREKGGKCEKRGAN